MNQLSQTILEKHQARKTRAQKDAFVILLREHFPELAVEEGGFLRNRNLILGDVEQAEVVLTAHYDTVARSLFPNLMMPQRPALKFAYSMLALVPVIAASLLCALILALAGASREVLVLGTLAVYYGLFFGMTFGGPPNPSNCNDNTSGVITLLELYAMLDGSLREKTAIVLFDNEEYGCVGSGWFYKRHKELMREKLLINFDCVGDGDHFLVVGSKDLPEKWDALLRRTFVSAPGHTVVFDSAKNASLSSDHKHFPCFAAVAATRDHKWLGLHTGRIHTPKDTVLEEGNIQFLTAAVKQLIAAL